MVAAFAEEHAEEFRTSLQQPALLESGTHPPCFYAAYLEFLQRQETSRMQQHSGLLFGYDFESCRKPESCDIAYNKHCEAYREQFSVSNEYFFMSLSSIRRCNLNHVCKVV